MTSTHELPPLRDLFGRRPRLIPADAWGGACNPNLAQRLWLWREQYIRHSFLVLTDRNVAVLAALARPHAPAIEVCAGRGWLTYWLVRGGVDVVDASDLCPRRPSAPGVRVRRQDAAEAVRERPEAGIVILCWPPDGGPVAGAVVERMRRGQRLLYVGEGRAGCTGCGWMFDVLERDFTLEEQADLDRCPWLYDSAYLYRRVREAWWEHGLRGETEPGGYRDAETESE